MSTVDELKAQLESRQKRKGGFNSQLDRYRAFKDAMAEAGVKLSRHCYDIPLMERMGALRKGAVSPKD